MLSRVAESLYWMSRHLERAEHTARLLDVNLILMLDQPSEPEARWDRFFRCLSMEPGEHGGVDARRIAERLTFDLEEPSSVVSLLGSARDNARQVRQQLSTETWEQLNRLYLRIRRTRSEDVWNTQTHAFFRGVMDGAHLVLGTAEATMSRGEGWHFMQLGRFLERATATAALVDAHSDLLASRGDAPGVSDYLDWIGLLKSRTGFEAYCQTFTADFRPDRIAEFLLLDPVFPRSARFAATMMHSSLRSIASATGSRRADVVERIAGRLRALLDYGDLDEILQTGIRPFARDIRSLCTQVHDSIHESYFTPPLETVLAS